MTLSEGIAIVNPKFPIIKAAEESALGEKNAKKHFNRQI
jgi:CRISPR/Cas system-associated protein Cas10 (large subunit of type III CRISPR-Cas system)